MANYTGGELYTVDVMRDKQYTEAEANAYIRGIEDSGASKLYEALKAIINSETIQSRDNFNNAFEALTLADGKET